jgi:hypothetical protein
MPSSPPGQLNAMNLTLLFWTASALAPKPGNGGYRRQLRCSPAGVHIYYALDVCLQMMPITVKVLLQYFNCMVGLPSLWFPAKELSVPVLDNCRSE